MWTELKTRLILEQTGEAEHITLEYPTTRRGSNHYIYIGCSILKHLTYIIIVDEIQISSKTVFQLWTLIYSTTFIKKCAVKVADFCDLVYLDLLDKCTS